MKTYLIDKRFNPDTLGKALLSVGIGVVTFRCNGGSPGFTAAGEVVTDDSADDAVVQSIIANHDGTPTLGDKLDGVSIPVKLLAAHNAILAARLDNAQPPTWAVQLVRDAQARIQAVGG